MIATMTSPMATTPEPAPAPVSTTDWTDNARSLGLIAVQIHENPDRGWWLSVSHGEPPKGFYASAIDARKAGDRHMRAQLERTLSLLTLAEDEPNNGSKPRPCGLVLLYPTDDLSKVRRTVMTALMEVS